jgi:hypothetical protein
MIRFAGPLCIMSLLSALSASIGYIAFAQATAEPNAARHDEPAIASLKTFGTSGKQLYVMTNGKEAEFFHHDGHGCLTHMWFGGNWPGWDRTRVRIYVDGEQKPSIDMDLGMGHGVGFEDAAAPWGIARLGRTGSPSGIYDTLHIPFGTSIRVTGQLPADVKTHEPFWWIIRGTENLPVKVAGMTLPDNARLHLYKLENHLAQPLEEFDLCDTHKAGALYLVAMAARCPENMNYMEAQMRGYLDGAKEPLMLSSGLEDYFLGTYYFHRGKYQTPVAGLTHIDRKDNSFSAYRFHDDDPIFFQNGLRLTCRCGEKAGTQVFGDPKPTTYTTYTWVYEW